MARMAEATARESGSSGRLATRPGSSLRRSKPALRSHPVATPAEPKSSKLRLTPSARTRRSRPATRLASAAGAPPLSSSSSRAGSRPAVANPARTLSTSPGCEHSRGERFTETRRLGSSQVLERAAGLAQHPFADRDQHAGIVRWADEASRPEQAVRGVVPAQQRFEPIGRASESTSGLVVEAQLLAFGERRAGPFPARDATGPAPRARG